jgi:predicted flap endonuclease-1-like 5' DNA nuclease
MPAPVEEPVMTYPVCTLWWLLAAVLFGWLLCGWFARQYLPMVTGSSAEQEREILRLQAELAQLRAPAPARAAAPALAESSVPDLSGIDVNAARAAGLSLDGPDDLRAIEGVGPKIADIFRAAGVHQFAQIAAMTPAAIQALLDAAGPNFRIADPQTWPEQAALAAANRWAELKALQDELSGGRKV